MTARALSLADYLFRIKILWLVSLALLLGKQADLAIHLYEFVPKARVTGHIYANSKKSSLLWPGAKAF